MAIGILAAMRATQASAENRPPIVILCGPTASGKSSLAIHLAQRCDGVAINADSMQIYRDLEVVTARPDPAAESAAPHALYGVLAAEDRCSAARWRALALDAIDDAWSQGRRPIVVGGSGLYLSALVDGLSPMPTPSEAVIAEGGAALERLGAEGLHADLALRDPAAAAALAPKDRQRVLRAWIVHRATGRSILDWRGAAPAPALAAPHRIVTLDPPRPALRAAIAERADAMVDAGAPEEAAAFLARDPDRRTPLAKAVGVEAFAALAAGDLSRRDAIDRVVIETAQYAKRQRTWFRKRPLADLRIDEQLSETSIPSLATKLLNTILT